MYNAIGLGVESDTSVINRAVFGKVKEIVGDNDFSVRKWNSAVRVAGEVSDSPFIEGKFIFWRGGGSIFAGRSDN